MEKSLMDELVDRFLAWPLPRSVGADPIATLPGAMGRTGTNLLTSDEARQMIEHLLEIIPVSPR